MKPMKPMKTVEMRAQQLAARLAELDQRLQGIEEELETPPDPDAEERAVEREDDEVLEGIGLTALAEARMIRAALDRVADGSYGACVRCGAEISEARLDLLPATPFCRDCAR
jgi:RNA polymerase-binding transcription factor DksA